MLDGRSEILIRQGKLADAGTLADVFRTSWSGAYRGIVPHVHLENIIRRRSTDWWKRAVRSGDGLIVLEFDGRVRGYATFGQSRGRHAQKGEIYELYVTPSYQGLGFGEYLFEASRARLDDDGLRGLIVWALAMNDQAQDFYWRRGGRPVAKVTELIGGERLDKIAFAWS
ncbi:MAG: GNAT family N-acetyltransferase [Hyphomicrobium sp.]|nr:GNAT family N-acetyltransferase [Hyphomicrobium sp.]